MPKEEKPKEKKFYTVEIECLIPATVKYRVLVEDGEYEKAIQESVKVMPMGPPSLKLARMKRLSAKVYSWGTNMLRHMRRF